MVSLKITENVIIKVLLAILASWRWGPYGGPDIRRYKSDFFRQVFHFFYTCCDVTCVNLTLAGEISHLFV